MEDYALLCMTWSINENYQSTVKLKRLINHYLIIIFSIIKSNSLNDVGLIIKMWKSQSLFI